MNLQRTNILLVEDDPINQFVASSFLRKWGMNLSIANNGQEAVALIQSKSFNLILMDMQMPVMGGLEATSIIRMLDDLYYKSIPIIAFTAAGLSNIRLEALRHGVTDFVSKPFEPEELRAMINEYTGNPATQRPLLIDFENYTDGDPDFKIEFISLLIDNLHELRNSLVRVDQIGSDIFFAVCHKLKATLSMLQDDELGQVLEDIKILINNGQEKNTTALLEKKNRGNRLCNRIIDSLTAESNRSVLRQSA